MLGYCIKLPTISKTSAFWCSPLNKAANCKCSGLALNEGWQPAHFKWRFECNHNTQNFEGNNFLFENWHWEILIFLRSKNIKSYFKSTGKTTWPLVRSQTTRNQGHSNLINVSTWMFWLLSKKWICSGHCSFP